jgi:acyl carrier protein
LSTTFEKVAKIIADTSEIDIDTITPESHTIDDLGIDSLDFLDIVFAIDKEFGIKVPLEKWTQEVNDGKASTDDYFVMKNLAPRSTRCRRKDRLKSGERATLTRPAA